jgi:hypothetical protein
MKNLRQACLSACVRTALLATTVCIAGCAAPRPWSPADLDAAVTRGEISSRTPLSDFDLSGVVLHSQRGDRLDQRRYSYVDQPGGYKFGQVNPVKRAETEEERYQRLLGALSKAFRRAGCSANLASIPDAAFQSSPPDFKDPSREIETGIDDLALMRRSIHAIATFDRAWAEQLRQRAQQKAQQADFLQKSIAPSRFTDPVELSKSFARAREEREWSNRLFGAAAQIDRNVRILQLRMASIDGKLEPSRERLRAQLDSEINFLAGAPPTLNRVPEYVQPFMYISHLAAEIPLCGAGSLHAIKTHVFDRVANELLAPLREPFLRSTTSERSVFTGNSELDAAFFSGPTIAAEMQRRVNVIEGQRQAEFRRAAELRAAEQRRIAEARKELMARRVKENLPPDEEAIAEVLAREMAAAAAADPAATATLFFGMFGTVTYEATSPGVYCRMAVSSDGGRRECTHSFYVSVSNVKCARQGAAHRCSFSSKVHRSDASDSGVGTFTWRPDSWLNADSLSGVSFYSIQRTWNRGGRDSSGQRDRPLGEQVREAMDLRCEMGVASRSVCANR